MSNEEIEILHIKTSFVLKVTNRLIITIIFSAMGIISTTAYYLGGEVNKINNHEVRITNLEGWRNNEQSIKNEVRALKNANAK